jgi:mannosylfructose-phosphate synthase
MMTQNSQGSILMLSIHGYVSAEPELSKPDTGGQVVYVLELAKRFARFGYEVELVTRQFEDQPEEEPLAPGARIRRVPFGGKDVIPKEAMHDHLDAFVQNFLQAAEQRGDHYDIVHSHYWDAGWAGMKLAEALNLPHVHTPHSLGAWKRQQMLDKGKSEADIDSVYRFTERIEKERQVYHDCDYLVCTTEQQREVLRDRYEAPESRMIVIPAGIDDEKYTPSFASTPAIIRELFRFSDNDVYTVGRAADNKGIDLLIRAFPYVRELVPEARLQLAVGSGSEQDRQLIQKWDALAHELGIGDVTHWIGYIPNDKMPDYYRAAGVFALPSRYEPFGMTAIEAMACGTPTVVTVHGGLCGRINFGEHALYADPHDPQEFGTLLAMPIRYPRLRERLAVHGAELARQQFGWSGIAKQTLKVFHHVSRYGPLGGTPQTTPVR